MRSRAQLSALADLLTLSQKNPQTPGDVLFHAYVRTRRYMGSKDRRSLANHFYTCLRHLGSIQKASPEENPQAWAWTYAFSFCPDLLSEPPSGPHDLPDFSSPTLLDEDANFPEEFLALNPSSALKKALLQPAPLDLRVNTLKTSRSTLIKDPLCPEGCTPTPFSPWGLRLPRKDLEHHPWIQRGFVEVQDEGSQLIALATGATPGIRVLDYCAGAGGKTLVLASMMENTGEIIATDKDLSRLQKLLPRLKRAGVKIVRIQALSEVKGTFDLVLVDAPCSGSGTWRRSPWLKKSPIDWPTLLETQRKLLDEASQFVAPGGLLVYATCSLYRQENEEQARGFLNTHPDFYAAHFPLPDAVLKDECLVVNPEQTQTDGFFAAGFLRKVTL